MNGFHFLTGKTDDRPLVSTPHHQRGLTFLFLLFLFALPHFLFFSTAGVELLVASGQPLGLLKLLIGETIFTISVVYYLRSDRSIPHALNPVWEVVAGSTGFFLLAAALYSASLPLSSHYPKIARNLEVGFWIAILGGLIPIAAGIAIFWRSSRLASKDKPIREFPPDWYLARDAGVCIAGSVRAIGDGHSTGIAATNRGWPAGTVPIPLLALAFAIAVFPAELGRALGAGLIVYLAGGVFFATIGAARRLLGELHRRNIGPVWVRSASGYLAVAIAIWFVVGLSTRGHEVRHGSTDDTVIRRLPNPFFVPVPDAVERWSQENRGPDGRATMVLIATAGGGIRAAYWTSAVLSRLDQIKGFRKHLFAISSVSGEALEQDCFAPLSQRNRNKPGCAASMTNSNALNHYFPTIF